MLDELSGGCIGRVDMGDIYLCLVGENGEKGVYWVVIWYSVACGHVDGIEQAPF
jgi:hypothetical protein